MQANERALLTAPLSVARVRAEVVSFVRRRVDDAGAAGVVVPMSGGIDSTVTAAVAAEALPPREVLALGLPCREPETAGAIDARTIADGLGIGYEKVRLRPLLDAFEGEATPSLGAADRIATGNVIARLRMTCAYYAANTRSYLVLGTANRSERLLGYFTKHGDGGADLYPLGDLYKTEVRALAPQVGLPRRIIAKEPTAGFWTGQTDADELGAPYDLLDPILLRLVDRDEDPGAVADALDVDPSLVGEVADRFAASAHKRSPTARPGVGGRTP